MGVDMVEIDIQQTKDGHLILMHDETINRTTTGKGNVSDFTLEELKTFFLKNGAGHRTRHKIPTLKEALSLAKGRIWVNIDKGYDYFDKVKVILDATGTKDQVLIKAGKKYDEVVRTYPDLIDNYLFMPVITLTASDAYSTIEEYLSKTKVVAFELNFEFEKSTFRNIFNRINQTGAKVFVNSLWPELCASHDDDIAVEMCKPDESWGWLVDMGAGIIQTDRPKELLKYLENQSVSTQNTIYVNQNLQNNGDGSVSTPFNSINLAIASAKSGDIIKVAEADIYYSQKETTALTIDKNLVIIGGYDSDFSNIVGHTKLDGGKNVNHIISISENCDVQLHHVIITGGCAYSKNEDCGGGIYNAGSLKLYDVNVSRNSCMNSAGGGGIFNSGNLSLINCLISQNTGTGDGGGIYNATNGFISIQDSRFESNKSKSGSAIFIKDASEFYISSSSFTDNISETYGTVTFYNKNFEGTATIVNSTFANNKVTGHIGSKTMLGGSAVYWYGKASSVLNFVCNTVVANQCDGLDINGNNVDNLGGAIFGRLGNLKLNNNIIAGNPSSSGFGNLFKISSASIVGNYNLYGSKSSVNIPITLNNQSADTDILLSSIELQIINGIPSAILSECSNGTKFVAVKSTSSFSESLASVPSLNLSEDELSADLNNDGFIDGYLSVDQAGSVRNLEGKAFIGAIEGNLDSGINNIYNNSSFNLTKGILKIQEESNFDLKIFDMHGSSVFEAFNCKSKSSFDITNLPKGFYILSINLKNSSTKSFKLKNN